MLYSTRHYVIKPSLRCDIACDTAPPMIRRDAICGSRLSSQGLLVSVNITAAITFNLKLPSESAAAGFRVRSHGQTALWVQVVLVSSARAASGSELCSHCKLSDLPLSGSVQCLAQWIRGHRDGATPEMAAAPRPGSRQVCSHLSRTENGDWQPPTGGRRPCSQRPGAGT